AAVLTQVRYEDGRQGHMLAFLGAVAGAETALAHAAGEALTFSGIEAGEMDVTFLSPSDPAAVAAAAAMGRVGLRFDLPQPDQKPDVKPQPPGMDPDRPPRLR
ncbi:MAG: SseB family protein, partial [Paracoccaceae bacterium]|nr:SseB family protein [Paracoccaceae bacterium]